MLCTLRLQRAKCRQPQQKRRLQRAGCHQPPKRRRLRCRCRRRRRRLRLQRAAGHARGVVILQGQGHARTVQEPTSQQMHHLQETNDESSGPW